MHASLIPLLVPLVESFEDYSLTLLGIDECRGVCVGGRPFLFYDKKENIFDNAISLY